ncbi:MAG: DNA topoisomerase 3 [Saprospiraceae bacterium]
MKVCIAEKPSVAREIAYIIGARTKQDGYFEGNGYCVSWTFGHFCTLNEPDDYQPSWKKWNMQTLPILPEKFDIKLIANTGVKKQFGILKKLLKEASLVINCGDAGQEGELIQRWVLQLANYRGKVLRLWISSLTPEAIRDGFQNLKDASHFDNLYHAGRSRAIGDWLLGMNATRLYTLKFGGFKQLLSIGRVQTPTLAMLVERHHEIENFVPQPFWELQTIYREVTFNCEDGRFFKKEDGEGLLQQVENQPFTIVSFTKKKGKEYPPKLFDLTSLQVNCNKRFGFSADQTLKIVQGLYEQKLVTYPRVDTTYLPNDIYPKIAGILGQMTFYSQFTQSLLGHPIRKSKIFDDKKITDHHAIIPTGQQKSLPPNDQKVYDAIARRFIANFYPDCIVSNTTVIGESAEVKFKVSGKEILEEGWRILYPKPPQKPSPAKTDQLNAETPDEKEEEIKILPLFTQGETGPHTPSLVEKKTQAPKNYTEATLLRAMETAGKNVDDEELRELMKANGIGRPSTRANIIETLFKREYIQRQKKLVLPTQTGIQLIDTIKNELLKSAELTGQWEKELREIEQGTFAAPQFIDNMKAMVSNLVTEVKNDQSTLRIAPQHTESNKQHRQQSPPDGRPQKKAPAAKSSAKTANTVSPTDLHCPKCRKGKLLKGKNAYGCSEWKAGCGFRLPFAFKEKEIPENQLLRLMKMGATVQLKGFKENGKSQNGKLRFDQAFNLYLEQKETITPTATPNPKPSATAKIPDQIPCPKCGVGKVVKGKTAYGCSHWKTGCSFRYSFADIRQKAAGQTLSKALVWSILKGEV